VLVEEELARYSPAKDMLLTVGVFDGVHRGHKYLISKLREQARRKGLLSGVVTFRQHPEELLPPGTDLPFLTDVEERARLLGDEGVDTIVVLSFTVELARLGAAEFVGLLQRYLRMRGLVIGADFALGRGREGDTETLRRLGREKGFSVTVVSPLVLNGEAVSSTAVRKALLGGDMKKVRELVGRRFSLRGEVVAGAGRGVGLGFPTANLNVGPEQALPPDGVYAGWAHVDGRAYQAMVNIGQCPTFGGCRRTVEAYLVDYRGDLYGRELRIDFAARLRDEKKFESVEELKEQITEDFRQGRALLGSASGK
jgi:riboflavin kinase/FMN adenylyltransferase